MPVLMPPLCLLYLCEPCVRASEGKLEVAPNAPCEGEK